MLTPYRNDLPSEVWALASDLLSGKPLEKNHAIHVGYEVEGYALGQAFPDGPVPVGAMQDAGDFTREELALCCRNQANGVKQGVIPWIPLAIQLLSIIADLLRKQA